MTADTAKFVKGLDRSIRAIDAWAVKATNSVLSFGGMFGQVGSAVAGVIGDFFVKPLAGVASYIGGWGKNVSRSITNSVTNAFRGTTGYLGSWGKAFGAILGPYLSPVREFGKYLGSWGKALNAVFGDRVRSGLHGFAAATSSVVGRVVSMGAAVGKAGLLIGKGFVSAVAAAGSAVMSLTKSVVGLLNPFSIYKAIMVGGVLAATWNVVGGAIALSEQADRAHIVFGEFAGDVVKQANLMAVAFGVSRKEFIQSASAFGTVFEGVGYVKKDAAALSIHFVKLATDLSSLVHIPVEEAMEKIESGLAGQIRPLREVGVFMTEAGVETYAYTHKIAKLGAELTEQQKVQARVGFITEHLAIANNNLAITAEGAGNTVRGLTGRFENLKDEIGLSLLKFIVPAMQEMQVGIQAATTALEAMGLAGKVEAAGILGGVATQVQGIGWLQKSIMWMADAWQSAKIGAVGAIVSITEAIISMMEGMREFVVKLEYLQNKLKGTASSEMALGFEKSIIRLQMMRADLVLMNEELKKAPKASIAVGVAFEAAAADIAKARADLMGQQALDVNKLKPVAEAAKATAPKFAQAMAAGSKEAVNLELQSRYGRQTAAAKPEEKIAANTAKTVTVLEKIAANLQGAAQRGGGLAGEAFAALAGNF